MENLLRRFFRGRQEELQPPQSVAGEPEVTNPLQRLESLVGGGNISEVGRTVFDISTQLHQHNPRIVQSIERSRNNWSTGTNSGASVEGLVGELARFQDSFQKIARLEPDDSFVLYVPGGSGITRLYISRSEAGLPEITIDERSSEAVKAQFKQLSEVL